MLFKDPYSEDYWVGLTEEEWRNEVVPAWIYRKADGVWLWRSLPRPQGREGELRVVELCQVSEPGTLQFSRKHSGAYPLLT